MITEIKLDGLNNEPIRNNHQEVKMKIYHHVFLRLSLLVVKEVVRLIH